MGAAKALKDVGYYVPALEEKVGLSFRAPKSLLARLEKDLRLWKLKAQARGDDTSGLDRTHLMVNLMLASLDNDFEAYGGEPSSEEDWKTIEDAIDAAVKELHRVPSSREDWKTIEDAVKRARAASK